MIKDLEKIKEKVSGMKDGKLKDAIKKDLELKKAKTVLK